MATDFSVIVFHRRPIGGEVTIRSMELAGKCCITVAAWPVKNDPR